MGQVLWRSDASTPPPPPTSGRLAIIEIDTRGRSERYVVRVAPQVADLRAAADAAFARLLRRNAFADSKADRYFAVADVDWAAAFRLITAADWRAVGVEIVAGPVEHLVLGDCEALDPGSLDDTTITLP